MKLTGSQIILRVLREKGADTLFGYPGGAIIPFFDAIYDEMDYFKLYRPAHEQNGVHAADGYARTTGKVGVFVGTSGPGATNTITGIATAFMDSVPLLVITGQVANSQIGKDSFQEIDVTGITLSITKHNYLVRNIADLQKVIEEAYEVAKSDRPGPVLVDVPKDVLLDTYEYNEKKHEHHIKHFESDLSNIEKACQLINSAKRPVLYVGGGVKISKTENLLRQFSEKASIPVANSFMGLGTVDRNHPLSLGFLGMHGARETNMAVTECDLLIAIGARFSDRVIGNPNRFAPKANIIHIDVDFTELDKNIANCLPIMGDFKTILTELINSVEKTDRKEWLEQIENWKVEKTDTTSFTPDNIIQTINSVYDDNTIVATDVGQHQMWTGQNWKFKHSNEFVSSGGLGTMGFGLGASIGAQLGNPDKNTVLIIGDGCFRMSSQELVTVSAYNVPVRIFMFNNKALGMVRQWQKLFNNKRYSHTDIGNDVNYTALAEAYGIKSYCIDDLDSLKKALEETKDLKAPVFFDCAIDKDFNVFPMVPPGKPIDEILFSD